MPDMLLPVILEPLLKPKRYKIVVGGRGSAKSQTVADLCLKDTQILGIKTGCFREFQASIEDSVHALLSEEIIRMDLKGFVVLNNSITDIQGKDLFKFRGLAKNIGGMKSMHGFRRFWCEEAQTISQKSLKTLTPTLRTDNSEIWMTANPMSRADPFSQRFLVPFQKDLDRYGYYEDELHIIIMANYMDNPMFPQVLEDERAFDQANLSTNEYEHIWLGKYNDEVDGSIIPVRWFDAAIDAHLKLGVEPLGAIIVASDPSGEGDDPAGLCTRHGSVITDVLSYDEKDANLNMDIATDYAIDNKANIFRWDCDGMGAPLKRQVSTQLEGKGIEIDMFKGSETADNPEAIYQPERNIDRDNAKTNKETFRNKRAQYYFYWRDRFEATYKAVNKGHKLINPEDIISISSKIDVIDEFRTEVCRIPRKKNANGLLQIMTKDEMKSIHDIDSPNLADSGMMTMKGYSSLPQQRAAARPVRKKSAGGWT